MFKVVEMLNNWSDRKTQEEFNNVMDSIVGVAFIVGLALITGISFD